MVAERFGGLTLDLDVEGDPKLITIAHSEVRMVWGAVVATVALSAAIAALWYTKDRKRRVDPQELPPFPDTGVFTLLLEARAALRLRRELTLDLHYMLDGANRRLELHLETEYDAAKGFPHPILLATAKVTGSELGETALWTVGFVRSLLNCFAVATNAFVEDAQPTYVADTSAAPNGLRRFLQVQSQLLRQTVPSETRLIDYDAAEEFSRLVLGSDDEMARDRLGRAIQQYVLALKYWNPEQRVLSVGHAFMAAEALTPLAKRSLRKTDDELAELEKDDGNIKHTRRNRDVSNAADNRARRAVIFDNDAKTLRGARELSDGFEHGFRDYDRLKKLADDHGEATMRHVRRAIIELSSLRPELKARLLDDKYDAPVPLFTMLGVLGHFTGTGTERDYATAPLDLSKIEANVESYDPGAGSYKVNVSTNYVVTGTIPLTITEIKGRH